jgi:hypothetical protein
MASETYRLTFLIIIFPMASVRAFHGSGRTARPIHARRLGKAIIPQSRKCNRSRSATAQGNTRAAVPGDAMAGECGRSDRLRARALCFEGGFSDVVCSCAGKGVVRDHR